MMPELYLAEALGAVGKPMIRVHTAGLGRRVDRHRRDAPGAGRHPRAGPHGRLREAVREQRHVGAVDQHPLLAAARRRRRWLLRPDRPRLHPQVRRPAGHRLQGGPQGPPQRAEEPLRAPARSPTSPTSRSPSRPLLWDPIRYAETCPSSDGAAAMVIGSRGGAAKPATARWPGSTAPRCGPSRRWVPAATGSTRTPAATCAKAGLRGGRDHRPVRARSTAPRSTCRSAGSSRCGWRTSASPRRAAAGRWCTTARPRSTGDLPINMSGGRAVVQPDRGLRDDPLPRSGQPGARPGRRPPGRRREDRDWVTPTAAARSSSRCGSSARSKPA